MKLFEEIVILTLSFSFVRLGRLYAIYIGQTIRETKRL